MRICLASVISSLVAVLAFSSGLVAQAAPPQTALATQAPAQGADGAIANIGTDSRTKDLPFDHHDLSGFWQIQCRAGCTMSNQPAMTAWGKAQFDAAKPGIGPRAQPLGNDPMMICDPLGIPRILLYPATPVEIVQTPDSMYQIFDWFHTFRKISTDGKEPPKNSDPRWFGYSTGRWDGDTFVVDSIGFNDRTWLDQLGNPHSDEMKLQERWRRVDHDTLELSMTVTDPKAYTKPWVSDTKIYKLATSSKFLESFCVPSDEAAYKEEMRDLAGDPNAPNK
jgi:hypothetical protein